MVNILVPTDFSELSKVAIDYAVKMANKFNGNITLLHVITNVIAPIRSDLSQRIKLVERELVEKAQQDFIPILKQATKDNKTANPIIYKIEKGESFNKTVKLFAKKNRSGLIVMGTRGASGVAKYVLGSNTVSILEGSQIPILAIPHHATFKSLKNVAYASDVRHLEQELKRMLTFLKIFDSTLHVFHVTEKKNEMEAIQKKVKGILKANYPKSTFTIQSGKKIEPAIDSFVKELNPDMLSMFTHEQSWKLFGKSFTKKMAFHSTVPLLVFRSDYQT